MTTYNDDEMKTMLKHFQPPDAVLATPLGPGSACPICGNPSCLGNECVEPVDEVEEPVRTRTCNKCKHCGRNGNYIRCDHPDVKGMEEADGIAEDFAEECETYELNTDSATSG